MAKILGVDIAKIVNGAFKGRLHAATLHKITETLGSHGEPVRTAANHSAQGVRLAWDSKLALARGYPKEAVKILILQDGICPTPTTADEITIGGERWRVIDKQRDPVDATWTLAGVPA